MSQKYTVIFDDDLTNILYNATPEAVIEALKIVLEYHKSGERPHGHQAGLAQYIANNIINSEERAKAADRRAYQRRWDEENRQNRKNPTNPTNPTENEKTDTYTNTNTNTNTETNTYTNTTTTNTPTLAEVADYGEKIGLNKKAAEAFHRYAEKRGWEKFGDWQAFFATWASHKHNTEPAKPSYDIDRYEKEAQERISSSSFDAEEFFQAALFRGINEGDEKSDIL